MVEYQERVGRLRQAVFEGTAAERKRVCQNNFIFFALYYFAEYFTYPLAPFHYDMMADLDSLTGQEFSFLLWVMFRESAKTTMTKLYVIWLICFQRKHYINWDSYVKDNAAAALFDITLALQTNPLLIADFGHLYIEKRSPIMAKTLKKVEEFITSTGIKVQAFSTQETTRGRIHGHYRPDMHVLDDFETSKTKASRPVIRKIQDHIDEMMSGLSSDANVIFLCNLLTESGVVANLLTSAESDPKFRIRRVDVIMDGKPAWPEKYTLTDREAIAANKTIMDLKRQKISLESRKRTLNASGRRVFEVEMMNSPEAAGDLMFDRKLIDKLISKCENSSREIAGLKLWAEFNPSHRYAIGADTSAGVGRDYNASIIIDFSTTPAKVVGTYKNNVIGPDVFGYELKRQGYLFGLCLIAPERNGTGYATIAQLKKIYDIDKIWRFIPPGKAEDKSTMKLGWDTNGTTKPEALHQLRSAVMDGKLEILDEELLREMRSYSQADLADLKPDSEGTRHFDLLMACMIAWAMINFAELPAKELQKRDYKQPDYHGSVLEGGKKAEQTAEEAKFGEQFITRRQDHEQQPYERNQY